ncbi:hypothetical protein ACT17_06265 [Mycolicibacterium conceptionense]|uniref:Uncharacterized protein n=1 Tax=Mycolicibacterium conceptionense TaxID=451644 RepID=A0A0J8X2F6_9MYCO|nr:hypothetical protein [Mycolicibacterium conceptionense]KMV19639.1 hypothetical protein ACT17_06265 [Mycolicibacterium conceptionense]
MAETTFPERQRCKTCRGKLDQTVLNGLFCSYRCAKHPEPAIDPAKAPRECAYQRDGRTVFKRQFRAESEIPDTILSRPDVSVYRCKHCLFIHTGTAVARTVKESKSIGSMAELSEVLIKARGKATRTTVGKVAGVRPIRIKEIEEGADRVDPEALFALLRLYRISLSVGFR